MTNQLTKRLGEKYFVTPKQINVIRDQMFEAFGNTEAEGAATLLVKFALNRRKGWAPFTQEEIDTYYSQYFVCRMTFNLRSLRGKGENAWIIEDDGKFYFTEGFVLRCYETNPSK